MAKRISSKNLKSDVVVGGTQFNLTEERIAEMMQTASKNGSALKKATAKNGGRYPLTYREDGTSVLSRCIFAAATKAGETEVTGEAFLAKLEEYYGDAKKLNKLPLPENYGNLKNMVRHWRNLVKTGKLIAFVTDGDEGHQKVLASLRKTVA